MFTVNIIHHAGTRVERRGVVIFVNTHLAHERAVAVVRESSVLKFFSCRVPVNPFASCDLMQEFVDPACIQHIWVVSSIGLGWPLSDPAGQANSCNYVHGFLPPARLAVLAYMSVSYHPTSLAPEPMLSAIRTICGRAHQGCSGASSANASASLLLGEPRPSWVSI